MRYVLLHTSHIIWTAGSPGLAELCCAQGGGEQLQSNLSLFRPRSPLEFPAASIMVARQQHHSGSSWVQGGPAVVPCGLSLLLLLEPVPEAWCHLRIALLPALSRCAQHRAAATAGAQLWPVCSASITVISEQENAEWEKET